MDDLSSLLEMQLSFCHFIQYVSDSGLYKAEISLFICTSFTKHYKDWNYYYERR